MLMTSRKLCHYFDAHKISVVTDFPLEDILHNWDATGVSPSGQWNWGLLLSTSSPKIAIKSQALVDFMAES
jgi:hypothetical protein